MVIGDVLYFSPRYKFADLDFNNPDIIAQAFQDRVEGFFLMPAKRLIDSGDAFAAGLVICAGIEFITTARKEEPKDWIEANVPAFRPEASSFWENFRNGLTHEGRIKGFGQFSLRMETLFLRKDAVLVVNPAILLGSVMESFGEQCANMSENRKKQIAANLSRYFEAEARVGRSASSRMSSRQPERT